MKYGLYINNEMDGNGVNLSNVIRSMPMKQLPPLCAMPKAMKSANRNALKQSSNFQDEVNKTLSLHERCQSSDVPNSSSIPSTNSDVKLAFSSARNGQGERSKRELISLVKQQLHQLNETLAALERQDEDIPEILPGQLTPPNDVIDQMPGKISM